MTTQKTSTTMPKKKQQPKQFYIAGKDEIKDTSAPVVGGEFITQEGDWQGQTVQVQSETHLEDDKGTGEPIVIRTFEFAMNPQTFKEHELRTGSFPSVQHIFQDHQRGIESFLWQDGLTPAYDIEPRVIFPKGASKYFIMVGARPQTGQTVIETPKTLSELAHDPRDTTSKRNKD